MVGSGGVGAVGRFSSMRSRSVGGTTRPGTGGFGTGACGAAGGGRDGRGCGCGRLGCRRRGRRLGCGRSGVVLPAAAQGLDGASATATGASGGGSGTGGASTGSGSAAGSGSTTGAAATGFAVLTRRGGGRAGAAGFTGSGAFFAGAGFLPLAAGVSAKMFAARQLDVALFRESIDELARHHFLDRARGALDLDAVIALEKRRHFLARGAEQFRDLENPNSCQTSTSISCSTM